MVSKKFSKEASEKRKAARAARSAELKWKKEERKRARAAMVATASMFHSLGLTEDYVPPALSPRPRRIITIEHRFPARRRVWRWVRRPATWFGERAARAYQARVAEEGEEVGDFEIGEDGWVEGAGWLAEDEDEWVEEWDMVWEDYVVEFTEEVEVSVGEEEDDEDDDDDEDDEDDDEEDEDDEDEEEEGGDDNGIVGRDVVMVDVY